MTHLESNKTFITKIRRENLIGFQFCSADKVNKTTLFAQEDFLALSSLIVAYFQALGLFVTGLFLQQLV